ncbi:hypothetical protein Q673_08855 [Marinobacter sp. EN3]|jgi:hypothetical protein|uniref:hypothetical protein n=1 Tax=Marinobacter sp. EN3 TaxID=1397533 RepID=UPI0003B807C8|nr:hypothetical protein [Marinobacter sp. EN3]ERS00385.1 hypothetical protein Q673_08855 [Marinobacter sp. EN3]|tara:strand:- start:366 stop:830 length:465 start_codon:yes stop_codon:yes gene_type:complete
MQPFRLRLEARQWFKELRDQKAFKTDFDAFYFCFIAGVTTKRKEAASPEETAELVAYFPDRYSSRGKLLLGLFLKSELEVLGVSMDERRDVYSTISRLVTPEAPNYLSVEGVREFNKYAHGGYDQLIEWFGDKPRSLETFLRGFKLKIDQHEEF